MNDSIKKVQILARAQSAIVRAQLRRSVRSLVLVAVGLVFALLAIGVLNYAAFASIEMRLGPGKAGLIVGCLDLLLAGVLFFKALSESPPTEEEKLAEEISEMATEGLSSDLDEVRDELRDFMKSTRKLGEIAHQVTSVVSGPVAQVVRIVAAQTSSSK